MNIAALFIKRPVMTTLVMTGIVIFGVAAFKLLPVSDLPNVDFPTIQVSASLPGASPETMASAVATVLEKQFSTIPGLDSMSSSSSLGNTGITLQFNLDRDIDAAAQDVQAAIAQSLGRLPHDMPSPPSYSKVNPADQPIIYFALTSETLPLSKLNEYGEVTLAQRISTVSGVAQVQVFGSQKYAVRIQLNPQKLASKKIGIDEVASAIENGNVNLPTGVLQGKKQAFTIEATGQLNDAAAYRPLIVAYRNGSAIKLEQLGRVIDSVENDKTAAWFVDKKAQQRAIVLAIQKQPGTNTVQVAEAVMKILPKLKQQLPASVSLNLIYDRSQTIRESVHDVEFTLVLTLGLVILVIFLFLRNFWATIIPSLTLPIAVVGTFAVMYLLGYSLDNLSLMALTLSVGFVVDDAIVMLENIVRHNEMGKPVMAAALDGAREIGFTIVSMTVSLAAVFIPVLFMGGIVGRLFREFAVTIGAAVLVSGVVALTLTPMLSSRMLKSVTHVRRGRMYDISEKVFNWGLDRYEFSLRKVLYYRRAAMIFSAAVLALTGYLFYKIPKGFLPSEDRNMIFASTEAAQGISFESLKDHQQELASVLQKDPAVEVFMSRAGASGGRASTGTNTGLMFARLVPREQRDVSADELIERLRPKLSEVPGIRAFVQNPPVIQIGGRSSKSQYQYTIQGSDQKELYRRAQDMEVKMRGLTDLLQDVTSDMQLTNPQVNIHIDREKASIYGLTAAQIENALYYAYGSRQISTILTPDNQYYVIVELEPEYQAEPEGLSLLYVRSQQGELVPLSAVSSITRGVGPLTVNHSGQLPSVTISFNLKPGVSLGQAVEAVNALSSGLPATLNTSFQGTAQAFQASLSGMGLLLAAAILVIYLVLGILYESYIHPLTILTALPFAGFGALLTLIIFRSDLSLYAFVGIIMLVGLVKKNGIMMVDFAIEARRQGMSASDAIVEACTIRFRPIMMTTMAALMAALPIAMGYGAGAESRRPLGLAVVGGLIFSQTLTLYITPVFYTYMEDLRNRYSKEPGGFETESKSQQLLSSNKV